MENGKPSDSATLARDLVVELVPVDSLKPHPQNYREHRDDQRAHLVRSITEHGFYRNVVVSTDDTILAGHGVVEAARSMGLDSIPVVRLAVAHDDPQALKVLTGDNEIARLALIDDRQLAELLRSIRDVDVDELLGTGYDDAMLANLVFVTRGEDEIARLDDAAAWIGLPEFEGTEQPFRVIVSLESEADRDEFLRSLDVQTSQIHQRNRRVVSIWWPLREREDLSSLRFEGADA